MAKRRKTKQQHESDLWIALGDVLARSTDKECQNGWETVSVLRSKFPSLSLSGLSARLTKQGLTAPQGAQSEFLTKLVELVQICGVGERAAQDLEHAGALIAIARSHPDLVQQAEQTAGSRASAKAKGAEQMEDRIQQHVEALREAAAGDAATFKAALKAFFADQKLDSKARKSVAATVTGSPAKLLGSDAARKDELERWRSDGHFQAARAEQRAVETTRF